MAKETPQAHQECQTQVLLPRITITYCTQCKWMLRAAYFAQELLSTFSLSLGEVALKPSTGGIFTVDIIHSPSSPSSTTSEPSSTESSQATSTRIWNFKTERAFPEVKILKRRVRDIIDPDRDLGHVDKHNSKRVEDVSNKKKEDNIPTPRTSASDTTRNQGVATRSEEDSTVETATLVASSETSTTRDDNDEEEDNDDAQGLKRTTVSTDPQSRNPAGANPSPAPPYSSNRPAPSEEESANIRIPATLAPGRRGRAAPPTSQDPPQEATQKAQDSVQEITKTDLHISAPRPPPNTGQNQGTEKEDESQGVSGACEDCA